MTHGAHLPTRVMTESTPGETAEETEHLMIDEGKAATTAIRMIIIPIIALNQDQIVQIEGLTIVMKRTIQLEIA